MNEFLSHLQLFRVRLEGVDLNDLLEPVKTDEDESVVQFCGGRLGGSHFVDEEPVQAERLLVHNVLHADLRAGGATRRRPV